MNKLIKIGIIGCANIALRFLIPAIKNNPNFELAGIASRSIIKAKSYAASFDTIYYDSYEDLISSDLDAVYIPLPNGIHYDWIKKSLNNNLHVLVEKSLACSFEEVKELNSLAKAKDLVLMENFQFRFHNQLKHIKDIINSGAIGDIRLFRSCFGFPPFEDKNNIRYKKEIGGGALLDAGAYTIKASQIFLGQDLVVQTANINTPKNYSVDISGSATLKQNTGNVIAQIAYGFDHFYQNNIEFWGSKGKLSANRIFTAGPGVKAEVKLEQANIDNKVVYFEDNHFDKMLNFYSELINTGKNLELEYSQNENQARLINDILSCS